MILIKRYHLILVLAGLALTVESFLGGSDVTQAQTLGPGPNIFSGAATTADGQPVPDGFTIEARVGGYESQPVDVRNGEYWSLTVGPSDNTYHNKTITFHLAGVVDAAETAIFSATSLLPISKKDFHLTFPNLPLPTPTPTATPTETPTITPTPEVALPSVYSGDIAISNGLVPEGAELVARMGEYVTFPAVIQDQTYQNLIVDPGDISLVGSGIEFFLNGEKAQTSHIYRNAARERDFTLVFAPLPTPTPTLTPVVPTATKVPPTATAVAVIEVATATPTSAPEPTATNAPVPVAPASTSVPPANASTSVKKEGGGGCGGSSDGTLSSSTASLALILLPFGLRAVLRRRQAR